MVAVKVNSVMFYSYIYVHVTVDLVRSLNLRGHTVNH